MTGWFSRIWCDSGASAELLRYAWVSNDVTGVRWLSTSQRYEKVPRAEHSLGPFKHGPI